MQYMEENREKNTENLNFSFSKSPFCKAAMSCTVLELSNSKVSRMLSHVQSLVCKRIKHLLIEKEIINPTNADRAFIRHQRTDSSHAE